MKIIYANVICIRKSIQTVKKLLDFRNKAMIKERSRDWNRDRDRKEYLTGIETGTGTRKDAFADP